MCCVTANSVPCVVVSNSFISPFVAPTRFARTVGYRYRMSWRVMSGLACERLDVGKLVSTVESERRLRGSSELCGLAKISGFW